MDGRILAFLAATLAGGAARAQPVQLEVAGAGEVVAQDFGEAQLLPGNLASVSGVATPRLIRPGTRINGVYCRQFGFSFRIANARADTVQPVTIQVTHPLWTLPDGRTGTQEQWPTTLQGGNWSYVGYSFTEAWSLEPGPWVFTIRQGARVLAEQRFQVDVTPGQVMPSEGCAPSVS